MKIYKIINSVYQKHRGLAGRLSELWGKSPEWYRSWGRASRTEDPFGSGNKSVFDEYVEIICNKFAAASPEAARDLHAAIDREIRVRLAEQTGRCSSQQKLRRELTKEFLEAICAFDECELEAASSTDLLRWDDELRQAIDQADCCRAKIRHERIIRRIGKNCSIPVSDSGMAA